MKKKNTKFDQKFAFDFDIFYLPMTIERTFAVKLSTLCNRTSFLVVAPKNCEYN